LLVTAVTLVVINIFAGLLEGFLPNTSIYEYAWPMELIAVGMGFSMLAMAYSSPWLLIPAGLVLGNGLILAYYAFTGNWNHWAFLWPLEPLLVLVAIGLPIWLGTQGERGRAQSRKLGTGLSVISAIALPLVIILALIVALLRGSLGL
jgi:hypothetical protein